MTSARQIELKPTGQTSDHTLAAAGTLDHASLDEFRALIQQAASGSVSLQAAASDAGAVHARLAELAPVVDSRIDQAGRLLETVQTLADQSRNLLAQALTTADRVSRIESQLERSIAERLAAFDAQLVESVARAEASLAQVQSAAEAAFDASVDRATSQIFELDRQTARVASRVSRLADDHLSPLRALCERAETLLGAPGDIPSPGSLAEAAQRTANIAAEVNASHAHLKEVRQQAEATRLLLGQALLDSAGVADEIARRTDTLRAQAVIDPVLAETKPRTRKPTNAR